MKTISLDIETFSDINLNKCGVYRYVDSPCFDILLFAYSIDGTPVKVIDLACGEKLPEFIVDAILNSHITKTAFNAQFERVCLMKYLSRNKTIYLDPSSWCCSQVQAAMLGLPLSLDGVAKVLKLEEQKMSEGKALIRYFCTPCKPTKANGERTRNMPFDAPEKWELFKKYNVRDVEVELAIREKLKAYPVPEKEQEFYILDQKVNDRGLLVDMNLVEEAIFCDRQFTVAATDRAYELTGLENPNSVSQLKAWLKERGVEVDSLSKKAVTDLVEETEGEVVEALKLRLLMAKTSVKKYEAIERAVVTDGRVHGLFQFYGANRTGRWSGKLVQFQNLPQNHLRDLNLARDLIKEGRFEDIELLFENTPGVLSELIRTTFIPKEKHRFIVADFSAIEARVISWLAGEKWRLDVFASHGKIYEAAASMMFHVPIESVTKGSLLRQKGKISELACIAEGELVLTDKGLVPIENVTINHKLWDGIEWVIHEGVIYKGKNEVIEYEGLRATADHLVWIEGQSKPVFFGDAATCSSHLLQTGNGRKAIRLGENNKFRKAMEREMEPLLCPNPMHQMQEYSVDKSREFKSGYIKRMPELFPTKADTRMVRPKINRGKIKMSESKSSRIPSLWRKRNRIQVSFNIRGGSLDFKECERCQSKFRDGSDRQQWTLRKRQYQICTKEYKPRKSMSYRFIHVEPDILALCKKCGNKKVIIRNDKRANYCRCGKSNNRKEKKLETYRSKVRVYDILNAGRNNRFTVSGKLVHNCGYGGGVGALKSMGALDMGVEEHELQGLIDNWRRANPHIVKLWWDVDRAVIKAVKERGRTCVCGIIFTYKSGMLFVTLPSGRNLVYVRPRIRLNKFGREGLTYEGIGTTKKWERLETYGPKIVENIVQAISRDLLAEAMLRLDEAGYRIVGHVHDEVIIEAPYGSGSLKEVLEIMAIVPSWAGDGLPLKADGYECGYYKKD